MEIPPRITSTARTSTQENNTQHIKITRKKQLFLLFWVAEEDKARNLFSESAQTRANNIKKLNNYDEEIHKVHCPPLHSFSEIQTIIDNWIKHYGEKSKAVIKEIAIFSHSGWDGPIIYSDPVNTQLPLEGWGLINFNWYSGNVRCTFFGCNSANNPSFAQTISYLPNFSNVEVGGQSASSFPSFYPSKRFTSFARSNDLAWSVADTYMVGSKPGKGKEAHFFGVEVEPMRFYKNGNLLYEKDQSFFNYDPKTKAMLRR